MEMTQKKAKVERALQGVVVKAKAEKTVSVSVERVIQHPMYGKTIKKKPPSWPTTRKGMQAG
jgi:small subunit ribosomal protein S17